MLTGISCAVMMAIICISKTSSGYTNPLKTTTLQISGRSDDRPEIR